MYFLNYIFMCLIIGLYLFFQFSDSPFPDTLRQINTYVCWGFLLWGGFSSGRVIVDCISLSSQGQMSAENVRNGILMSILHFIPTLLMSVFLLKEGFAK